MKRKANVAKTAPEGWPEKPEVGTHTTLYGTLTITDKNTSVTVPTGLPPVAMTLKRKYKPTTGK